MTPSTELRVGLSRVEITAYAPGTSMWGWGAEENVAVGVAAPLHARAIAIAGREGAPPFVFVCAELGMISEALRTGVLAALQAQGIDLDAHRLALTATHTHSGPSGFSASFFYALAGPGFSRTLYEYLVAEIARAVRSALEALAPARAYVVSEPIPLVEAVSFNRSIEAYNRNPEVTPVGSDRSDEAVDRTMTLIRFEGLDGRARGLLSFFAVHGTSIHADNDLLHPDNPGVAARATELALKDEGTPDFVAVFAQESAGDVSPNYRWHAARRMMIGRFNDDFESATWNGEAQSRHARRLLARGAIDGEELTGPVTASIRYVPFHAPDEETSGPGPIPRTSGARLGVNFCLGTLEGPGPLGRVPAAARAVGRICALAPERRTDAAHAPKEVVWDLGTGGENRVVGWLAATTPALALLRDRRMRFYRAALGAPGGLTFPWVPHHLPFQVVRIGSFAAAFLPFEATTIAGRRIRREVASALAGAGVRRVVAASYANAYASYLTTPEEYDAQAYEGSATLFGRRSLDAVLRALRAVAGDVVSGVAREPGEPLRVREAIDWLAAVSVAAPRAASPTPRSTRARPGNRANGGPRGWV